MEQSYCEALKFAIEFEHRSEDFYRGATGKVKNAFAKKALEFLAADEVVHAKKIEEFNTALINRRDFDLNAECRSDLPQRLDKFLDQVIKKERKEIKMDATDIDVYSVALDMEKTGYNAYKSAYNKEDEDPRVKQFFKFLADQEIIHYNLLAASKKYLEDPSYYFEEYGGWIFG